MKCGGTLRATKKMTHIDNGPGPGWNYGETAVLAFCRNEVFGLKFVLFYLFGKRVLFSLHHFAWAWLEHGFDQEVLLM